MKLQFSVPKLWLLLPIFLVLLIVYRFSQLNAQSEMADIAEMPMSVATETVTSKPLTHWIFSEGTLQAKRKAFLNFETSGKVVAIAQADDGSVLREGVRVFGPGDGALNGQLLAQIDSRDNTQAVTSAEAKLQAVRAQKHEAEARLQQGINEEKLNKQSFARMQSVFERGVISQDEFDRVNTDYLNATSSVKAYESQLLAIESELASISAELNRASINLEKTSLFAPFNGVIIAMNINEDNYYYPPISGGNDREREANSALVLVDDSEFEIQLSIPSSEAQRVIEGQEVYIARDDQKLYDAAANQFIGSDVVKGVVWSVSPSINLQQRSQTVKVRVRDNNHLLKEGQFVRAWVATEQRNEVITLPLNALMFRDGKTQVFVIDDQGLAQSRQITLGQKGLDKIEVTSGIALNDQVVVRGQHLLIDGSKVTVVGHK